MSTTGRYQVDGCLYESATIAVYRARDTRDGSRAVLKQARWGAAGLVDPKHLWHELEMLRIFDRRDIVKARGIEEHEGLPTLVLEDFGGEPLDRVMARQRLDLATVLRLAAGVADALAAVHEARVLHRDVHPGNLLVAPSLGAVQLIDFDIAARVPRDSQGLESMNRLEGTLPFISPEQTGRMSRSVDHRTDLYSLGATLYAMLTGGPPFPSGDPMEIIHAHLARRPASPSALDGATPQIVSDIVLKLLSKAPEERYRTASGLRADLSECLAQLERDGDITPFRLGRYDISNRLQIPERLYGREAELALLDGALERASRGTPELVLVSGHPGIGKSALIRQVQRSVVERRGYFISGKFDQFQRDIPYSALLQALSELVRQLLAEPEPSVEDLRRAFGQALGAMGRVLTEIVPEAEFLLGARPPLPELPPAAAESRFRYFLLEFIDVCARRGHPLAIFLDDLHWADPATLDLLPSLLSDRRGRCLLLLGAFRDSDVTATHPLQHALAQIEENRTRATQLALGPLDREHLIALSGDALALDADEVRPVAEIVWRKTRGNPFFAAELLKLLVQRGLLWFDPAFLRFRWDLEKLADAPISEDVVDLMVARLEALSARSREVLELAAVIGGRFELEMLATADERTLEETALALAEAVDLGLLMPLGEAQRRPASPRAVYRFLHDRVQQAVAELIDGRALRPMHLRIGRLLRRAARPSSAEVAGAQPDVPEGERLFEILNHLNAAAELIDDPAERRDLGQLNLAAGRRAMASSAFAAAPAYFSAGIRLLPEDAWAEQRSLAHALHLGLAECESARGMTEPAERAIEELLAHARSDLETAELLSLRRMLYQHRGDLQRAVGFGLQALAALGIKIPPRPSKAAVLAELARTKLALRGRRPADLLSLPELADPRKRLALKIMVETHTSAGWVNRELFATLVMRAVALSAEHGNSEHSSSAYGSYGTFLIMAFGAHEEADALYRTAIKLLDRYRNQAIEAKVKVGYAGLYHWCHPLEGAVPLLWQSFRAGADSGQVHFAGTALNLLAGYHLLTCRSLRQLQEFMGPLIDERKRLSIADLGVLHLRLVAALGLALEGRTRSARSLDTDDFDEQRYVAQVSALGIKRVLYVYHTEKMKLLFLHGHKEEALSLALLASIKPDQEMFWTHYVAVYHAFAPLVFAAAFDRADLLERRVLLLRIHKSLRRLKRWAGLTPENFAHHHALASAELARIQRDDSAAIRHYQQAIALARQRDLPIDLGLAEELAGSFYEQRGATEVAMRYFALARHDYERVGAKVKVSLLDARYPELSPRAAAGQARWSISPSPSIPLRTGANGAERRASEAPPSLVPPGHAGLDLLSVLKATHAFADEMDLSRLVAKVLHIAAENAGAERGVLLLHRDGPLLIQAEYSTGHGATAVSPPKALDDSDALPAALVRLALRARRPIVLADATREGEFTADPYVLRAKPRSVLCAPIRHQGDVKGVIYLENNLTAGAFTDDRTELLTILSSQMAISIENATVYADLERLVQERTRELNDAQARLIALERNVTEVQMAGGFAHEMRNTLTGAKMLLARVHVPDVDGEEINVCVENSRKIKELYLEIKDHLPEAVRARAVTLLRELNANEQAFDAVARDVGEALDRGLASTCDILDYARLGNEQPGTDLVALRPLVDGILRESEGALAAHGISVALGVAPECAVVGKESHLYSILKNLVLNAIDALLETDGRNPRSLAIAVEPQPQGHVLSVTDTGVGILPEHRKRLFEPFFSTKGRNGTGLGLGVVRKLVGLYQGTIDVDTDPGRGTRFRVTLPSPEHRTPATPARPADGPRSALR